jgi:energy-coupling factor transporter transmembrane protein EcfT
VLREVIDIATVYKARGSEGLKYWLQVATASIITSLARAQVLADALKARGVEITE